tara:strand:+ start:447 stop:572 length:126 start_codon:yes stop_codon:yes gene_type:complete
MPYGQNLRVKKARAASEAKKKAKSGSEAKNNVKKYKKADIA